MKFEDVFIVFWIYFKVLYIWMNMEDSHLVATKIQLNAHFN